VFRSSILRFSTAPQKIYRRDLEASQGKIKEELIGFSLSHFDFSIILSLSFVVIYLYSLTLRHLLEKNETSTFDLKFLPVGTLTSLNLEGGKLEYSMGAPPVTFSMLTTLELNNLTIDPTGIQFPENGLTRIEIHNAISVTGGYEFIGAIKSLASLSLGGSSTGKPADFDLSLLFESRETLSSLELKFLNLIA